MKVWPRIAEVSKTKTKKEQKENIFLWEVEKIPMCLLVRQSVTVLKEDSWLASLVYITCLAFVDI